MSWRERGGGGKNVCISLSQSFYNRQNPCIVLTPGFISRLMCSLPSYHSPLLTTIKHTTCNKVTSAGKHGAVAKNNNNKYTVYKMLHHSGLRYMTRTRVGFCCCCCFVSLCGTNNDVLITLTWTQTKTCSWTPGSRREVSGRYFSVTISGGSPGDPSRSPGWETLI